MLPTGLLFRAEATDPLEAKRVIEAGGMDHPARSHVLIKSKGVKFQRDDEPLVFPAVKSYLFFQGVLPKGAWSFGGPV